VIKAHVTNIRDLVRCGKKCFLLSEKPDLNGGRLLRLPGDSAKSFKKSPTVFSPLPAYGNLRSLGEGAGVRGFDELTLFHSGAVDG
jgi:hypothetical protein